MRSYTRTGIPTAYQRLLMDRLGTGYTRRTWTQMRRAGGARQWFDRQLSPGSVRENTRAKALPSWYPDLARTPAQKWADQTEGRKGGWEYARDLENLTLLRRAYSDRPVLETMTDFWANHLHVPANADLPWVHRWSYEQLLRTHALGRFDTLLRAATLHPAMLLYLDTWRSTAKAPNENHGRELLELHTVGRGAGYTEGMVQDTARILSGHTVDAFGTWAPGYDTGRHATGAVDVLGFRHANAAADGRPVTDAFLRHLAHHPATARNIARALAVKLVSDTPSSALVGLLARTYLRHGTAIRPVLKALVASEEFKASAGRKVRTPHEDLVATIRALGVQVSRPQGAEDYAHTVCWAHGGVQLYQWPRPDGAPEDGESHASASRMLASFSMHWNHVGGWWPTGRVAYRSTASWLPQDRIRLDAYVDHLSRTFHGRGAGRTLVEAACQATGYGPGEIVTRDHPVAGWLGVRLIGALLDSPQHMSR